MTARDPSVESALDVLFVHAGNAVDPRTPIHLLPMGVPSMADLLARRGRAVEIVHLALERVVDPAFDLLEHIAGRGVRVLCLDLHWHAQSHAVVELARRVKERFPDLPLVLGGYTASAFAVEIVADHECVDFVVRGDGEDALAALVDALLGDGDPAGVPNLVRRQGRSVVESAEWRVNGADDLARFRYCAFETLRHAELYGRGGVMEGRLGAKDAGPGIFYCNCGRGCPYDCVFCGGSRSAQRRIACRERVVYRPIPAMLDDLTRMERFGLGTWYNTFHPTPDETYFLDLFEAIRDRDLRIGMIHECLHLPSPRFVEQFARTFGPVRRMDFVILTGDDDLRRRSKGNPLDGEGLLERLGLLNRLEVDADLCFLTGLPGETAAAHRASMEYVARARRRHPRVRVNAELLAIEPLSPMAVDPGRHGIHRQTSSFRDYCAAHAAPDFVGYDPGGMTVSEARQRAAELRSTDRGATRRRLRTGARDLPQVQLHDVRLWDGGERYGLGIPSLVASAEAHDGLRGRFGYDHHSWIAGRPGYSPPSASAVAAQVLEAEPVLAGFSLATWCGELFAEAARRVRAERPDLPLIAGGPLATCLGAELVGEGAPFDAVVSGYGEGAFAAILGALTEGHRGRELPPRLAEPGGIFLRTASGCVGRPARQRYVPAPDPLPSPYTAGTVALGGGSSMLVSWCRGCEGRCTYCAWHNQLPRAVPAPLERVREDLDWARARGIDDIDIADSALDAWGSDLAALCDLLRRATLGTETRFTAFLRHEELGEEHVRALSQAPFRRLNLGLQTDDPRTLQLLGRPPLDRGHFEWVVSALGRFARVGVQIISGLPGDTYDRFQRRLDALLQLDCDVTVFPLQVTPGTRLWGMRERLGIDPRSGWEYLVTDTPTLSARDHRRCLERAAHATATAPRAAHGVHAPAVLERALAERAAEGPPVVQLHHANVDDAGANFGLGVPFLIAHVRGQPELRDRFELVQVDWEVDHPDVFRDSEDEMVRRILRDAPALVGFSLTPWSLDRFLSVIQKIRALRPTLPILVGGPNAGIEGTALMERVPEIDLLVPGEGEIPFAALLSRLAAAGGEPENADLGSVPDLRFRREGEVLAGPPLEHEEGDLDPCGDPFGDGLVHVRAQGGHLNVEWTRGCPNRCTYCAWPRQSHRFRRFSEDRIHADVAWAIEHGFGELLICDAAINYRTSLLRSLCGVLEQVRGSTLRFSAFLHWQGVSEDQIDAMFPVAWGRLMLGLQTDCDEGLAALGRAPFDAPRFERSVSLLSRICRPYVELMTGVPGDTSEKIERRVEYALGLGCRVSVFPLLATRGTAIWETCRALGAHLDSGHQNVVRALPTMDEESYAATIQRLRGLGHGRDVLELAGYHFLGIGPQAAATRDAIPVAPPESPHMESLRALVRALVDTAPPAELAGWSVREAPTPVSLADLDGGRLIFEREGACVSVDVFGRGQLASPLAEGDGLAFCPADDGGRPAVALAACQHLAQLDRRSRDD